MQRISSNLTKFWKRFFPIGWLALVIVLVDGSRNILPGAAGYIPPVVVVLITLATGVVVYRRFAHGVVNEVWDDGAWLVVKQHGEHRIPLHEITEITSAEPNRVTLKLAQDSPYGKEITFLGDKEDDELVPELRERILNAQHTHTLFGEVAAACPAFSERYDAHRHKFRGVNANVLMSSLFELYTEHKSDADGKAILSVLEKHRTSHDPVVHDWVNSFFEMVVSDRLEEIG